MVETMDNGKPINESSTVDVPLSSDHFRYFAGVVRAEEDYAVMIDDQTLSIILREPIGLWARSFRGTSVPHGAWKIAPALAAGDTVVIKPSSVTPLSILEFAKIIQDVVPPGVVNVVTGRAPQQANICWSTKASVS